MKRAVLVVSSCVALAGLVSCGGGGDDVVAGVPSGASAEGYYAGNLKVSAVPAVAGDPALPGSATAFQMLVLENGQFWTFYGTPSGTSLVVRGFAQGTGTSNGSVFIAGGARNFADPTRALATDAVASASYNAAAGSISGTITDQNSTSTLTSVPPTVPGYSYAASASLGSVEGTWSVQGPAGDGYTLVVDAAGRFSGTPTSVLGCSFTGRFVPRPTARNVLDVTVTNGPAPCTEIGLVSNGVGYVAPVGAGNQLTFATVSANRVFGGVISGVRP